MRVSLAALVLVACGSPMTVDVGGGGGGTNASTGGGAEMTCTPGTFATADAHANAVELIVTTNAYAASFQKLAALHSALGTPAEVLTLEQLCQQRTCDAASPKTDTVAQLKIEIMSRAGLKYVLLGGAFDTVPARTVSDSYADPFGAGYSYDATYESDYFYSDFSEWDTNGDGTYADPKTDSPDYLPDVAVSRLPVRSVTDVDTYVAKVVHHLTAHGGTGPLRSLLISNIATTVNIGFDVKVDSALYFENPGRTLSLLPAGSKVTKLYSTTNVDATATPSTPANESVALDAAPDIVVHSGHAGGSDLMTEQDGTNAFTSTDATALTNADYPFFFSCGCEAGDSTTPGNAGEALVMSKRGGAIAYLGNVPVGLGIAGGMQIIDETLRFVQAHTDPLLGDAYLAGHQHLPTSDSFTVPVLNVPVQVVNADSWRWTQKGVMLFGDLALPMWSSVRPLAPTVSVTQAPICQGTALTLTLSTAFTGTLRALVDGKPFAVTLANQSSATLQVQGAVQHVDVGLASDATQFAFTAVDL